MRVQLDCQNGNRDQTIVYILDTIHFMPEVLHLSTTHPQYHVVFEDGFTMVPYIEAGTILPHWSDLLQSSSELASKQAFNLAQAWLGSTGLDNTNLQFMDNPVIDLICKCD
jgi:hypothetical protein